MDDSVPMSALGKWDNRRSTAKKLRGNLRPLFFQVGSGDRLIDPPVPIGGVPIDRPRPGANRRAPRPSRDRFGSVPSYAPPPSRPWHRAKAPPAPATAQLEARRPFRDSTNADEVHGFGQGRLLDWVTKHCRADSRGVKVAFCAMEAPMRSLLTLSLIAAMTALLLSCASSRRAPQRPGGIPEPRHPFECALGQSAGLRTTPGHEAFDDPRQQGLVGGHVVAALFLDSVDIGL